MNKSLEKIEILLKDFPVKTKVFTERKKKKNGGYRTITKPDKEYNKWLKRVNNVLCKMRPEWPDFMCGGVRGRSYVNFVQPHVGKKVVISMDIKDCFDSIPRHRVEKTLIDDLNIPSNIASELALRLCYKGYVPQGFSTSSFIVNLCLVNGLSNLKIKLNSKNIDMSIYVDDMAISGNDINVPETINTIAKDLSRLGFSVNKSKVKVMKSDKPQIICGLMVNNKISLPRNKKDELISMVTRGYMTRKSLNGWLSFLKVVDCKFGNKLRKNATKKGLIN